MISVFTPTYNRKDLVLRLYHSLLLQSNPNFEWVIVDDGSTDDTESLVQGFKKEGKLTISYHKQVNSGKHFAINKGVQMAQFPYFFIVDSDDMLPQESIQTVLEIIKETENLQDVGGVSGTCITPDFQKVGGNSFEPIFTNSIAIRNTYNVKGDLAEVFKTDVLKEFPFPEIVNEKFCPEVLVWNRIAQKYKLYYTDKPIYIAEYQPDGLTAKIVKIRMNAPIATMLTYSELANAAIPVTQKVRATINFWRFAFNSKESFISKFKKTNPIFSVIGLPLGYIMYKRDIQKYA